MFTNKKVDDGIARSSKSFAAVIPGSAYSRKSGADDGTYLTGVDYFIEDFSVREPFAKSLVTLDDSIASF